MVSARITTITAQHPLRPASRRGAAMGCSLPDVRTAGSYAFAGRVADRYRGRFPGWSALNAVWKRVPAGRVAGSLSQRIALHLAPRISITVPSSLLLRESRNAILVREAAAGPPAIGRDAGVRIERESAPSLAATPILAPPLIKPVVEQHVVPVMRQYFERTVRVESSPAAGQRLALQQVQAPGSEPDGVEVARRRTAQLPVEQVLRRQQATSPASKGEPLEASPPPGLVTIGQPARQWGQASDRGMEPHPNPVDINDLTDRVVQAIDRRVIAQRERMGR